MPEAVRAAAEALGCWDRSVVVRAKAIGELDVVMLSGLPGAGKDTWLSTHRRGLPVVSLDALRLELGIAHGEAPERLRTEAFARARAHLDAARPFAWNATMLRRRERRELIDWLTRHGARVTIVCLEVGALRQRQQNRARRAVVPRAALERLLGRWEPVIPGEAHAELFFEDGAPRQFEP